MFDDLRQLLRAAPFEPFRIHLNEGQQFDVHHPEFISISRSAVHLAVPTDSDRPHHHVIVQVRNITSVEKLSEAQQQS